VAGPALIVMSGLPGVGKTTIARDLARRIGAVHLRIDSIEAALGRSVLAIEQAEDAGYQVAYALAGDNLTLGLTVIADSVNPVRLTREAWHGVGRAAGCPVLDVAVICSDQAEHRRRVEARRAADPTGWAPDWQRVLTRGVEPWEETEVRRLVLDTADHDPATCGTRVLQTLPALRNT